MKGMTNGQDGQAQGFDFGEDRSLPARMVFDFHLSSPILHVPTSKYKKCLHDISALLIAQPLNSTVLDENHLKLSSKPFV